MDYNFCFLCLTALEQIQIKRGRKRKEGLISRKRSENSIKFLVTYLLSSRAKTHDAVLKDVLKLSGVTAATDEEEEDEATAIKPMMPPKYSNCVRLCEKCEGIADRILELHLELEKLQMNIIHEVKTVREEILKSSGWLGGTQENNDNKNEEEGESNAFENFSTRFCNADRSSKATRRTFDTLKRFQTAVSQTDKDSIHLPLIFLDKYSISENCRSFLSSTAAAVHDVVKTEPISLADDFIGPGQSESQGQDLFPPPDECSSNFFDESISMKGEAVTIPTQQHSPSSFPAPTFQMADDENGRRRKKKSVGIKLSSPSQIRRSKRATKKQKYAEGRRGSSLPGSKIGPYKKGRISRDLASQGLKLGRSNHHYNCESEGCSFRCYSLCKFEQHLRLHETLEKAFHCDQCAQGFSTQQHYTLHQGFHLGHHKMKCDVCPELLSIFDLPNHMKSHSDSGRIYPCEHCSHCFASVERHILHIQRNHFAGTLNCQICGEGFEKKIQLMEHLHEAHQLVDKFMCEAEGCGKTFLEEKALRKHRVLHTGRWSCVECGKWCGTQFSLDYHRQSVHGTGSLPRIIYKCSQCPATFLTKALLNRHKIREHAVNFTCKTCGKDYQTSQGLRIHTRMEHDAVGNKPCPICNKKLANASSLRLHTEKYHSTNKNYVCEECGKTFRTMDKCRKHKLIHGEKKYQCSYCPKTFAKNDYLIIHIRTHTGQKPYSCDLCGKAFSQRPPMTTHRKRCPGLPTSSSQSHSVANLPEPNHPTNTPECPEPIHNLMKHENM